MSILDDDWSVLASAEFQICCMRIDGVGSSRGDHTILSGGKRKRWLTTIPTCTAENSILSWLPSCPKLSALCCIGRMVRTIWANQCIRFVKCRLKSCAVRTVYGYLIIYEWLYGPSQYVLMKVTPVWHR